MYIVDILGKYGSGTLEGTVMSYSLVTKMQSSIQMEETGCYR